MKSFRSAILLLVCVLVAGTAFAQGRGRIEGKIVDEQGQPVAEVLIRAQKVGSPDEMAETKSNAKGEFTLQRVSDGQWRVEFQRDGLEAEPTTIEVAKNRAPALTVTMAKPVDPMVVINNELKRAAGLMQGGDITGARAIYEELHAKFPEPFQFPFAISTTYAAEKNFEKALEYAKIAAEKEPTSVDVKMLTAEIHMEAGNRAEALAILEAVDLKDVQDPVMFINAGIILINDKKPDEAIRMFDRLLERWPDQHQIYYYRGRAHLAGEKMDLAKADFEKFISVAPADSKEVAAAKQIIAEIDKAQAKKDGGIS
jgi:predicted Zn-dependent protease